MSKPVIIIVPGAWHRPQHYQRLNDGLKKFNYEAIGVTMPSVDSNPVVTSWDKDAEAVREQILKCLNAGKDVIVIAHSYGGVPMSEAVKGLGKKAREEQGLKGGVVRLIYMCAIATVEGESLMSQTAPVTDEEKQVAALQAQGSRIEESGTISIKPSDRAAIISIFYNRCTPTDASWAFDLLGTHPPGPFVTPVTYTAYLEIPSTYIVTENDHALLLSQQERMIARAGGALEVERCQEGHSPFISDPEFVVGCIGRAAGEEV